MKRVVISKGTVRLVELHMVTHPKDGEVYLDFLFTKKRVRQRIILGLQKLRNLFVNVLSTTLLIIQELRDNVVISYPGVSATRAAVLPRGMSTANFSTILAENVDSCAQIWGMDGPYCDKKYVCEDERYVFTRGIVC